MCELTAMMLICTPYIDLYRADRLEVMSQSKAFPISVSALYCLLIGERDGAMW